MGLVKDGATMGIDRQVVWETARRATPPSVRRALRLVRDAGRAAASVAQESGRAAEPDHEIVPESDPAPAPVAETQPAPQEKADAIRSFVPQGHFYSPIVDPAELTPRVAELWPATPEVLGIDFNDESHRHILGEVYPRFFPDYDYPEVLPVDGELTQFFTRNDQFSWLDARTLFVLLREWRPRRLIEVGSGFSSLLMADVNRRFLDNSLEVTCVEPYPRQFLLNGLPGISQLIQAKVQDVPLSTFDVLEAGDVLFIDSSHVAKTGSDVNYLYFQVLPRLRPGVRVHIHDIFLPMDYPREWAIEDNRSWNEQYLLHALLMHSSGFRVLFGSFYANFRYPELVRTALSRPAGLPVGGGSFWIERL